MISEDIINTKIRYRERYKTYGKSVKTLGWDKGKQDIRLDILTSSYSFNNKSVLDIGCGFGDLIEVLRKKASNFSYVGIDLVDELILEAKKTYNKNSYTFYCDDFLNHNFEETFDYCIASGIFNHKLHQDNYSFIKDIFTKAWDISVDGFAFDFLSDRVDYKHEHTFHSSPSVILDMAYSFSKNVILRNDYMPFEFSIFVFKDDSFKKSDTLFCRYKRLLEEDL